MSATAQMALTWPFIDAAHQQVRILMVEMDFKTQNTRLAALMERAQVTFERSRHLVEEARKIRAEAEAKRSRISAQSRTNNFDGVSLKLGQAADADANKASPP
jgi:hypothetical protein